MERIIEVEQKPIRVVTISGNGKAWAFSDVPIIVLHGSDDITGVIEHVYEPGRASEYWVEVAIRRAQIYYEIENNSDGGFLRSVLGDGNLDDTSIMNCIQGSQKDEDVKYIVAHLLNMTLEERKAFYARRAEYDIARNALGR